MATRVYIAKAATPEQLSWRRRVSRFERPLLVTVLAWMESLHAAVSEAQVVQAVASRSAHLFDQVVQAVALEPELLPAAESEAEREFRELVRGIDAGLRLRFDLQDPNFRRVVERQQAALVREVTGETRRAIANMIVRAYERGQHPLLVAPQIRAAVGLTSRQAQAVLNMADAQTKAGVRPDVVADWAIRYAGRLRTRRAKTIARTETVRGLTLARLASYEQAAAHGLFDRATAELQWNSVQDDPKEICYHLDGQRVPFGQTFDGMLPPVHPACRCSISLLIAPDDPFRRAVERRVGERLGV